MDTGAKVVPLAMTGWDRRPRIESPVFWEHNEGWGADIGRFYEGPKPVEIGRHVRKAVEWTRSHPTNAEAQAVIIYAWNEHDEGGWLPHARRRRRPHPSNRKRLGTTMKSPNQRRIGCERSLASNPFFKKPNDKAGWAAVV